jgi:hypothetical protein
MDPADLGQLVGRAVSVHVLAPAPDLAVTGRGSEVLPDLDATVTVTPDLLASAGAVAEGAVPAVVVGRSGDQLSLASEDRRLVGFHAHRARVDAGMGQEVFRVSGVVRVARPDEELVLAGFVPEGEPERLQRREWIRVATAVEVCFVGERGPSRTTTVDLSGGGARVERAEGMEPGTRLEVQLALERGPVELVAHVLGPGPEGTVRLRFVDVPEGMRERIMRHVYAAQIEQRRAQRAAQDVPEPVAGTRFGR